MGTRARRKGKNMENLSIELKKIINDYFTDYGYEEQSFGNGHFEKHYDRYVIGIKENLEPFVIDDWIELERVLGIKITLKQATDVINNLYIDYDIYVSDLGGIMRGNISIKDNI